MSAWALYWPWDKNPAWLVNSRVKPPALTGTLREVPLLLFAEASSQPLLPVMLMK